MSEPTPNATELVERRTPSPPDDPPQVKASIRTRSVNYRIFLEWEIPTVPRVYCCSPNGIAAFD